jgi:hypothetical protein
MNQVTTRYTKWLSTIPNGHNTFSISRTSKIFPNWDFLFQNIPTGNPGVGGIFKADFFKEKCAFRFWDIILHVIYICIAL